MILRKFVKSSTAMMRVGMINLIAGALSLRFLHRLPGVSPGGSRMVPPVSSMDSRSAFWC